VSFADFLEAVPPNQLREITDVVNVRSAHGSGITYEIATPELSLHCGTETCNGKRFFRYSAGTRTIQANSNAKVFFTYLCANCQKTQKIFALHVFCDGSGARTGSCYKFGEHPNFGPPTPTRLLRLFGNERDLFLKGRRCENQGLGVAAFAYYRRVVENHKNQIFAEIIKVAEKVGAPAEMIAALEAAKAETQFSKALASVKDALPQVLMVNGHNPLALLHSALSAGLHEQSDERCLELAHDVRVVLAELADRMGQALKDEAELNTAVSRLLSARAEKKS